MRRPSLLLLGTLLLAPADPARGAVFQFIGDGTSQNLHWVWSSYYPVQSCFTSQLNPCGAVFAVNGEIPMTGYQAGSDPDIACRIAKGKLEWSAGAETPTGQLHAVAVPWVRLGWRYPGVPCGDGQEVWASIDARDVPLEFVAISEVGDPPTLTLAVSPRLVGSVTQRTLVGSSTVILQYMTSIRVNGQEVTGDTLSTELTIPDSTEITWTPQLPDGAANDVVVAGLPWNSQISITLWAYMRAIGVGGHSRASATGSHGDGLALMVDAWAANAVAVGDDVGPDRLWLSAGPNPTAGPMRIQYALPAAGPIRLSVYDVGGGRVTTLAARNASAGRGAVTWDGRDDHGSRRGPGLYFVELVAGSKRQTAKVALLGP